MLFLAFLCLLYFLPSLIARDKSDAGMIFLVNFLFGWTVIGWLLALIWACSADPRPVPVRLVTLPAGRFCVQCGTLGVAGGHFCSACGRATA